MDGIVPAEIKAGLTFSNLVTLTAYPAPDWALSVVLRGPAVINLAATADGVQHKLATTAAQTGLYAYSARVTRGDDVVEVESGTVTVVADLAQQDAGGDMRSHNRKVLDSIRAVIEQRATVDQERYRINNRELYRTPLEELRKHEAFYAARVAAEEAKARGKSLFGRKVRMRLN